MKIFLFVLTNNILPIFILIILGYILDKKFTLNIYTLSKLNFYIFTPAFVFIQLYTTKLSKSMINIFFYTIILLVVNYVISSVVSNFLKFDLNLKNAFKNSVIFYNSGNIGIPIITLVFSSPPFLINGETPYLNLALAAQIMVLVTQNIFTNTLGFFNAGQGNMHWKDSIKSILKMPTIYAIPLAFVFKNISYDLSTFCAWPAIIYIKNGMVPIALITLGVQLSKTKLNLKNPYAYASNVLRLIGGPILAYFILHALNITGISAQALMISSSVPTAVNTALIAVERNNEPDFASQVVMTSTILCSITLVFVVYLSRILFPIA